MTEIEFVEIVMPEGVRRRVEAMDSAWRQLSASKVLLVQAEYAAWRKWADDVINSWWARAWASGTLNDLDSWHTRYVAAWAAAESSVQKNSPNPDAVKPHDEPGLLSAIPAALWFGIGVVIAAVVIGKVKQIMPEAKQRVQQAREYIVPEVKRQAQRVQRYIPLPKKRGLSGYRHR